jgi:hypothetical protein
MRRKKPDLASTVSSLTPRHCPAPTASILRFDGTTLRIGFAKTFMSPSVVSIQLKCKHHRKTFSPAAVVYLPTGSGVWCAASAAPHCFLLLERRSWGVLAEEAGFAVVSSASACNQLSSAFPSGQPFCFQMKYARSAIWNCVSTFTTFLLCNRPSQPIQREGHPDRLPL